MPAKNHPAWSRPPRNVEVDDIMIHYSSYTYNISLAPYPIFLKLSIVRIFSNDVVHTKKAAFEGAFV